MSRHGGATDYIDAWDFCGYVEEIIKCPGSIPGHFFNFFNTFCFLSYKCLTFNRVHKLKSMKNDDKVTIRLPEELRNFESLGFSSMTEFVKTALEEYVQQHNFEVSRTS